MSPMLHTEFCGNCTLVPEMIFKWFLSYVAWRPSWSCDPDASSPYLRSLHTKFGFFGEDVSNCGWTDGRRTMSSP